MGLTSFSGELPALKDIGIAKNYLQEDELKVLNNLVSGYFDLAEINAIEHKPMYMDDYVKQLWYCLPETENCLRVLELSAISGQWTRQNPSIENIRKLRLHL